MPAPFRVVRGSVLARDAQERHFIPRSRRRVQNPTRSLSPRGGLDPLTGAVTVSHPRGTPAPPHAEPTTGFWMPGDSPRTFASRREFTGIHGSVLERASPRSVRRPRDRGGGGRAGLARPAPGLRTGVRGDGPARETAPDHDRLGRRRDARIAVWPAAGRGLAVAR